MALYYVNKIAQNTGNHEVHKSGCSHMPAIESKLYLGIFNKSQEAVLKAKQIYPAADGCYYCSSESNSIVTGY